MKHTKLGQQLPVYNLLPVLQMAKQVNINQTMVGIVSVRQRSSSSCGSRQLRHQLEGIQSTEIIRQHQSREERKTYTTLFATSPVCNQSTVIQLKAPSKQVSATS